MNRKVKKVVEGLGLGVVRVVSSECKCIWEGNLMIRLSINSNVAKKRKNTEHEKQKDGKSEKQGKNHPRMRVNNNNNRYYYLY